MSHVLIGAFVVAGALALAGVGSQSPAPSVAPESPMPAPVAPAPPMPDHEHAAAPKPVQILEGDVLETLDVPEYTYIRMSQKGAADEWVAVTSTKLNVGDRVRFQSQTIMSSFTSPKLKRTFDRIHFGELVGENAAGSPASPHGAAMPEQHPPSAPAGADVVVGQVEKADGPNGVTIAEVFAKKNGLAGKSIRVRGVVVKVTNGVMGKNFAHLRDGSGNEAQHDHDLTVTTNETLERGQTVLIEGKVTLDKDLGAGYRYDVLVEDAIRPK